MTTANDRRREVDLEVRGPWSLSTSKAFWEGFAPAALPDAGVDREIRSVFVGEADWMPVTTTVTQNENSAHIEVRGAGDLDAAVDQVARFLSLDIDARGWLDVGRRDPVIADAQKQVPGLRPCGFHSPYEAAAWAVLSQRIRITQAARLRTELTERYGEQGAFASPEALLSAELDLPGRKPEYLRAVAEAALSGLLDGASLRALDPAEAIARVQEVKGLGPFAAELVVIRGANAPDALPTNEARLNAEITERYGADHDIVAISDGWRPFRSWAAVHLRVLREYRTHEIGG
ncbi:DNA-3-methyladenine glycosylase family protein [Subtercola endophyticus]|uniref:DNA-3-methyladenine glycosylase family protein n=1 Tax=Subtercola endophyticus TaxID=2895559 RepID=UPI001E2ED1EB|nr:hypothetical protein [Subtercola endophyticus]UFS60431.1 hypothetical protein LQ955_06710 [Subtercola endophyticus]